ncbi:MAG: hypothetical protein R2797_00190 [Gelidibacter sp.]
MANFCEVESALNLHYKKKSSPNQDAGLVYKNGYVFLSSLTLYVPESIDIDKILLDNPPIFNYSRDVFVYIVHLVTSIPARKRDILDKHDGYTSINRKILQKRVHGYKKYIEYLKQQGILIERNVYSPGNYSMGLKISDKYGSKLKPIEITKWTLIKSIKYLHQTFNVEKTDELSYLKNWFNSNLEIDLNNGVAFLEKLYNEEISNPDITDERLRYNCRILPLQKLHQGDYAFHVDDTGFRLHTNFTQLMSPLRKVIKYDGKTLCAIDIKNSQLYLSIGLLDSEIFLNNSMGELIINPKLLTTNNYPIMVVKKIKEIENESDVVKFKKYVQKGVFYEYFGDVLVENGFLKNLPKDKLRKKAKEIVFSSVYSPNSSIGYKESIKIFKALFPNVYKIFSLIKTGKGNHPALSICLQRFEAKLVLNKACKIISIIRPNIVIYTLHDSIITTEDNVEFVKGVLKNVLKKTIGVNPPLKIERWE